jgi:hypothetical protein
MIGDGYEHALRMAQGRRGAGSQARRVRLRVREGCRGACGPGD